MTSDTQLGYRGVDGDGQREGAADEYVEGDRETIAEETGEG